MFKTEEISDAVEQAKKHQPEIAQAKDQEYMATYMRIMTGNRDERNRQYNHFEEMANTDRNTPYFQIPSKYKLAIDFLREKFGD